MQGAQAVIIATAHDEFKTLPPEFFLERGVNVVVDGQNCLQEDRFINAGILYEGIGKHYTYPPSKIRARENTNINKTLQAQT